MSESAYLGRITEKFSREHPLSDGWRIFRLEGIDGAFGVTFLPAFLRDRLPGAIRQENIAAVIEWTRPWSRQRRRLLDKPRTLRGSGFHEDNWDGRIDFVWRGTPVHVRRTIILRGTYKDISTLVATKDLGGLESAWRALRRYSRSAVSPRSTIQMVAEAPLTRPDDRWEDLILPGTLARDIRQDAEGFMKARRQYAALRLPYRRGFLFSGPPGCGKTKTVRVIAAQSRAAVLGLTLKAGVEDFHLRMAFELAEQMSPSILILEDLDRIGESPKVGMSYLLNLLDGLAVPRGVLLLATTNHPEKLDAALLHRPSRFDKVWHFPLPGFSERLELLRQKSLGKFSERALNDAARHCQGFTMAYVQETVVNAFLAAVNSERQPQDRDLADSVRALREQMLAGFAADGAIVAPKSVGFMTAAPVSSLDCVPGH